MPREKVDIRDDLAAIARAKARARNDDELPALIREELLKLGPLGDRATQPVDERTAKRRARNREYQRQRSLAERLARARKELESEVQE